MAKYLMLMCLLQLPLLLFLTTRKTAAELSQYNRNGLEIESMILSPNMKLFDHTPYDVASKQDTNSTSMVDLAIKACFVLLQDIVPLASINI